MINSTVIIWGKLKKIERNKNPLQNKKIRKIWHKITILEVANNFVNFPERQFLCYSWDALICVCEFWFFPPVTLQISKIPHDQVLSPSLWALNYQKPPTWFWTMIYESPCCELKEHRNGNTDASLSPCLPCTYFFVSLTAHTSSIQQFHDQYLYEKVPHQHKLLNPNHTSRNLNNKFTG